MSSDSSNDGTLGRIALKQVRVRRSDVDARTRQGARTGPSAGERTRSPNPAEPGTNPLNRVVPYLDLFGRLGDEELARLAGVGLEHVVTMRAQVDEISKMMSKYEDLVDRLSEEEFVRLTQSTPKIVRFWLLSRPRRDSASTSGVYSQGLAANESGSSMNQPRPGDSNVAMKMSPSDSNVAMRVSPPVSEGVDIQLDDSPGEASGEFDPASVFEDDDDDDDELDLF